MRSRGLLPVALLAIGLGQVALAQDRAGHEDRYRRAVAAAEAAVTSTEIEDARWKLRAVAEESASHPDLPRRFGASAEWLLAEIEGATPLTRLASTMDKLERRLGGGETGRGMQEDQARIISDLDRLIVRYRTSEGKGRNDEAWTHDGVVSLGSEAAAERRGVALSDLDRIAALQLLDGRYPTRYRDLVSQYYESIAGVGSRTRGRRSGR